MAIITRAQCADYDSGWEATFGKKSEPKPSDLHNVPRRRRIDRMTSSELACLDAIGKIESLGCDERLTRAQILISQAQELVADVVDSRL